jgi:hypothetical protein
MALVYVISASEVRVFDQTATEVTPSGAPFAGLVTGAGATGAAYDSANGLIYMGVQATPSFIVAFDKSGRLRREQSQYDRGAGLRFGQRLHLCRQQ